MKEQRWFRANVRPHGSLGIFENKDFLLTVTLTGSHFDLMREAVTLLNEQGQEVNYIAGHSSKRETL